MATTNSKPASLTGQFLFWIAVVSLFAGTLWLFRGVMLPFVLGAAIAYLLDPLVEKLARWKIKRWLATILILGLFFIVALSLLAFILPMIYREMIQLAEAIPDYVDSLWEKLTPYSGWIQEHFGNGNLQAYQDTIKQNIGKALQISTKVLGGLAQGGQAIAGLLSVFILTPIVAFFMMNEWPALTKYIDSLIPRRNYTAIKNLLSAINLKVSGFVRGQLSVAFSLALIYALALLIAGLNYGFLIGFMAGLLSIIPLVGSTIGLIVSIGVAWVQSGELGYVAIIAAIFMVGQFVEGNILTPKLLGKNVGMHPLWILFAIMAGGSLLGLVGMFVAVPLAASIGVLLGFAIERYKESSYYGADKKEQKKTSSKSKKAKA